jgi:hypothetical protein
VPANKKNYKRIVVSYRNLTDAQLELLNEQYPLGWRDHVIKVSRSAEDFFFAVMMETRDTSYLVKVDVEIDSREKLENDPTLFGNRDTADAEDEEDDSRLPTKIDETLADEDTE